MSQALWVGLSFVVAVVGEFLLGCFIGQFIHVGTKEPHVHPHQTVE